MMSHLKCMFVTIAIHATKCNAPPKLPKYSLANNLYIGKLPEQFKDITWVEEQVCALHRSTVLVYHLYHSDNPQDPYMQNGMHVLMFRTLL